MSHTLKQFIEAYNVEHERKFGYVEPEVAEVVSAYETLSVREADAIANGAKFTLDYAGEVESVQF